MGSLNINEAEVAEKLHLSQADVSNISDFKVTKLLSILRPMTKDLNFVKKGDYKTLHLLSDHNFSQFNAMAGKMGELTSIEFEPFKQYNMMKSKVRRSKDDYWINYVPDKDLNGEVIKMLVSNAEDKANALDMLYDNTLKQGDGKEYLEHSYMYKDAIQFHHKLSIRIKNLLKQIEDGKLKASPTYTKDLEKAKADLMDLNVELNKKREQRSEEIDETLNNMGKILDRMEDKSELTKEDKEVMADIALQIEEINRHTNGTKGTDSETNSKLFGLMRKHRITNEEFDELKVRHAAAVLLTFIKDFANHTQKNENEVLSQATGIYKKMNAEKAISADRKKDMLKLLNSIAKQKIGILRGVEIKKLNDISVDHNGNIIITNKKQRDKKAEETKEKKENKPKPETKPEKKGEKEPIQHELVIGEAPKEGDFEAMESPDSKSVNRYEHFFTLPIGKRIIVYAEKYKIREDDSELETEYAGSVFAKLTKVYDTLMGYDMEPETAAVVQYYNTYREGMGSLFRFAIDETVGNMLGIIGGVVGWGLGHGKEGFASGKDKIKWISKFIHNEMVGRPTEVNPGLVELENKIRKSFGLKEVDPDQTGVERPRKTRYGQYNKYNQKYQHNVYENVVPGVAMQTPASMPSGDPYNLTPATRDSDGSALTVQKHKDIKKKKKKKVNEGIMDFDTWLQNIQK